MQLRSVLSERAGGSSATRPRATAALLLALSLTISHPAAAGPFETGKAAYDQGDYSVALKLWQRLAESGQANAENGLGVLYLNGRAVPKDTAKGMELIRQAAAQGYARAQGNLASIYFGNGEGGGETNEPEALRFAELAAAQGDPRGQLVLGRIYHGGRGVMRDDAKAFALFSAAAVQGFGPAHALLGELYDRGDHVSADPARAYAWFTIALQTTDAEDWRTELRGRIDRLVARSTREEIEAGKILAARCRASQYSDCGLK